MLQEKLLELARNVVASATDRTTWDGAMSSLRIQARSCLDDAARDDETLKAVRKGFYSTQPKE